MSEEVCLSVVPVDCVCDAVGEHAGNFVKWKVSGIW